MKLLPSIFALILFLFFSSTAFAVENPFAVPNNKVGIHILFPEEIDQAAGLINGNGGDWGYVTIPIQAGDKNLLKWQAFMDKAKALHVIPIIRLATEGDYLNTKVWRKPTGEDVLDFANFLSSLHWPTKNKYVVVFNEVNRGDEWGGTPNPAEYTNILTYAEIVFANKNQNFFIISAGFDNAAITAGSSMNEYDFLNDMHTFLPAVFDNLDGIGSHSYPNPGFRQPPMANGKKSTASFKTEKELIKSFNNKDLPVFITETGWTTDALPISKIAEYYTDAFTSVWSDPAIVAVTPFLLRAELGPFQGFSLIRQNQETVLFQAIKNLAKTKGTPILANDEESTKSATPEAVLGVKDFSFVKLHDFHLTGLPEPLKIIGKWLLKI